MTIQIDLVTSGTRGLRHDAEMVHSILSPVYPTAINVSRQRNAHLLHRRLIKGLVNRLVSPKRIILFFEILPTEWMGLSTTRVLFPNQEWMRDNVLRNLSNCSAVWCKTRYAERIFLQRGLNARYVGFSSRDMFLPDAEKDYSKFIHVPGRSDFKGTRTILELWRKHPDWPQLLVITVEKRWQEFSGHNVFVRRNSVPEAELRTLMNEYGVHLCTSETEGYGHYIAEALSTKAVVITVDAPPMNELVAREHGLLASYDRVEPFSLSERFFVDPTDLQRQIETAIQLSEREKARMGETSRDGYLKRRSEFSETLLASVGRLVTPQ